MTYLLKQDLLSHGSLSVTKRIAGFSKKETQRCSLESLTALLNARGTLHITFHLRSRSWGLELGGGNTEQHKPHLVRPRTSKILECLEYEILHEVMRELKGWVKLERASATLTASRSSHHRSRARHILMRSGRSTEKFQDGCFTLTGECLRMAVITAFEVI